MRTTDGREVKQIGRGWVLSFDPINNRLHAQVPVEVPFIPVEGGREGFITDKQHGLDSVELLDDHGEIGIPMPFIKDQTMFKDFLEIMLELNGLSYDVIPGVRITKYRIK